MRVSGLRIDFVPPAESHESAASDVLEIVEVNGKEDYGEDEDEDEVLGEPQAEYVDKKTC